jgi:hypothetical protein
MAMGAAGRVQGDPPRVGPFETPTAQKPEIQNMNPAAGHLLAVSKILAVLCESRLAGLIAAMPR